MNSDYVSQKWFGSIPMLDPTRGKVVREAPGSGKGYWAGACSAMYDVEASKFYLYYRYRKPRGEGRGFECRIAESTDGIGFTDIWTARKEDFGTTSVERGSLVKTPEGTYLLYISYVDPVDSRWRIDVMEATAPSGFNPGDRRRVLTATDVGLEGVKDPYVVLVGRMYYMIISYAGIAPVVGESASADQLHGTQDAYNTGLIVSATGLATSGDGLNYQWQGTVMDVGSGWDAYEARVTSTVYAPPVFNAFYDGAADVEGNYEERTGLAVSFDLRYFDRITPNGAALQSPHASGGLRYIDAVPMGEAIYYYYEMARPDGAHDLMVDIAER